MFWKRQWKDRQHKKGPQKIEKNNQLAEKDVVQKIIEGRHE